MLQRLRKVFRNRQLPNSSIHKAFVDGHFYSPVVNTMELRRNEARIWPEIREVPDIDFNEPEQRRWLTEIQQALGGELYGGSSLWLRKSSAATEVTRTS